MVSFRRVLSQWSAVLVLVACGCGGRECVAPPEIETSDIVVSGVAGDGAPFDVDICIDATPSMEGFTAPASSAYVQFLTDLERSFVTGVKNAGELRFHKFGESIREVPREEFRRARSAAFYREPGIFRATNLELVFRDEDAAASSAALASVAASGTAAPPRPRVVVVVTDLFQRDQDVNAVVRQIKDHCLSNPRCSVGLLAIPSAFDGTVYDANVPSYPHRSTDDPSTHRPFYLLMFGPEHELRRFAAVLSSRPYIDLRRFTLIGGRTVTNFTATVKRDPEGEGVTPRKHCGSELHAAFNLRKKHDVAPLHAVVKIDPDPQAFGFDPRRVQVHAYRESGGRRTRADDEVTLRTTVEGQALDIRAAVRPPRARGEYTYVFEIVSGDVNGYVVPKWVSELTSRDPRPGPEAARTLNLDGFVESLIATSVIDEHHQPKLARFRVVINKL